LVRIKNALAGVLHIPAAKLRLQGNGVLEVDEITPEIQRHVDEGRIEIVPDDYEPEPDAQPAPPSVEPPSDFDTLDETDAVEYIEIENDPGVIQAILREEERPGVIDALKARLQEIEDAGL